MGLIMLYGKDKTREIARSVLPSARRKTARMNAATLKRRNRRATRLTLHEWKAMDNAFDFEGHVFDYIYGWGEDQNIKMNVWERRNADKLGALMRWAPAATAHLDDPEDRYMFIKRVMPDSLIGRHALSHLVNMEEFDFRDGVRSRYDTVATWEERNAYAKRRQIVATMERVKEILVVGAHTKLNRRIREVHFMSHKRSTRSGVETWNCDGCPLRLCHGLDDVEAFAADLVEHQNNHRADLDAVYDVWRDNRPRRLDA